MTVILRFNNDMKVVIYIAFLILMFHSCTKEKTCLPPIPPEPEVWEKFIGDYQVYDTNGVFLYQMEVKHHFKGVNSYGNLVDSLKLMNFADTADLAIEMRNYSDNRFLGIGFNDSVIGHNGQTWQFYRNSSGSTDVNYENTLINDTIILFFTQTNIQHWVNEGVPYYYCDCKQVAVKH
jgi:hypothetical protein